MLASLTGLAFAANGTDPSLTPLGARNLSLGEAGAAICNDGDAIFQNPAGLAYIKFPKFTVSQHKMLLGEADLSNLSFAFPTDWGTFGGAYVNTSVGNALSTMRDPITDRIIINPSGEVYGFDSSVYFLTYARTIDANLSVGGNYKMIKQDLSGGTNGISALANNLDLGVFYQKNWWAVSLDYQNILGGELKWSGTAEADKIPSNIKIGSAFTLFGATTQEALYKAKDGSRLIAVGDLDLPSNRLDSNNMQIHTGLEWWPMKSLAVRSGINFGANGTYLSYGVGFVQSGWRFDYSYTANPDDPSGDSPHYFTISLFEVIPKPVTVEAGIVKKSGLRLDIFTPADKYLTKDGTIPLKGQIYRFNEAGRKTITSEVLTLTREVFYMPTQLPSVEVKAALSSTEALPTSMEAIAKATKEAVVVNMKPVSSIEVVTSIVTKELYSLITFEVSPPIGVNRVFVNNIPAAINSVGSFEGIYNLGIGKNVMRAKADLITAEAGVAEVSAQVRVLRYQPFTDIYAGDLFELPIAYTSSLGLIEGYPDNTFGPKKGITRAELVTMLMRSQGIEPSYLGTPETTAPVTKSKRSKRTPAGLKLFSDFYTSHWAAAYVKAAVDKGIVTGYPDGSFRPNAILSRAEGVAIFARFAEIPDSYVSSEVSTSFSYYSDINTAHWVYKPSLKTKKIGMLTFINGYLFEPNAKFLRGQTADMLWRAPVTKVKIDEFWEKGPEVTVTTPVETAMPKWLEKTGTKTATAETTVLTTKEVITKPVSTETKPAQ
jgi:hypothetical protein